MNLTPPVAQRRNVLEFCLAPLRVQLGEEVGAELPPTLEVCGQSVDIDAWEQSALLESLGTGINSSVPWASLVTEGVAFRVGCKIQVASFVKKSSAEQSLISFVAAGLALATESQRLIDQLIVAGEVGTAKRLNLFRNKILQDVKTLRRLLDDTDFGRAEQESAELVGPAKSALPVSKSTGRAPKGAGEYKPRSMEFVDPLFDHPAASQPEESGAAETQQRRVRRMSLFLFASTLVWMIFFMPRLFEPRAQVLEKLQFEHLPAISTVTARPPSLYIEVQSEAWDSLQEPDREQLLKEVGRIAVEADYNGVQVRKEQGAVVGRWLREQGAELIAGS